MKFRLWIFALVLTLWVGAVGARLYEVQVVRHAEYAARAVGQQQSEVGIQPPRGTIFDARGRTLAVSVGVDSAFLSPRTVEDAETVAQQVSTVVAVDRTAMAKRLSRDNHFAWVARQLDPEQATALRNLEVPGLGFVEESKRYYPMKALAGSVLGFVGTDHTGLGGLEAQYEKTVSGRRVQRTVIRDALNGRVLGPGLSIRDAEPGADIYLTLDASIQHVVERELALAVEKHDAKGGAAVLMDPTSGAILAMASYPPFDPNRFGDASQDHRRNRAIQDAYEPGSTFKLVTAAAALERNLIDPVDVIDCERGAIVLGRTRIRDHKSFDLLSFREVIAKSSNVGTIKTGLMVGAEGMHEEILRFGFGRPTGIDLRGEAAGEVRDVADWHRYAVAYASIGQGISVTPLQVVNAFAAIANGGELPVPYVVRAIGSDNAPKPSRVAEPRRAVASPATVRTLVRLLESVVDEGTGRRAGVPGYRVAGKTGTAQKATPGKGYSENRHIASFAGFAPSRQPAVAGVVVVDEPVGLHFHGGDVAAPAFSAILRQVLPYLGIAPEPQPEPEVAVPEGMETPRMAELEPEPVAPERVRVAVDPAAVLARAAREQRVPDLAGLTAREAVWVASELGLQASIQGSGRVEAQAPPAGVPFDRVEEELKVWLSRL